MRIFILDIEYLSWNKKQSNLESKSLRSKTQHPEIIHFYTKEIFSNGKIKELEFFFKPKKYKNYPYRISKLTKIKKNFLDKFGYDFEHNFKKIIKFFPSKSLIITNGGDNKVLKINQHIYKIKNHKRKLIFIDLQVLIEKYVKNLKYRFSGFISTEIINKKIIPTQKISHNAKNDVHIIHNFIKQKKISKRKILILKNYFYSELF